MNERTQLFLEQYRIYRGETHKYLGYAASSPAYLHAFLLAELLAAAWDKHHPRVFVLIPITLVSYTALLALLYLYALLSASYSALLEDRINMEEGDLTFLFESYYSAPKFVLKSSLHVNDKGAVAMLRDEKDRAPMLVLWVSMFLLPLAITAYAFLEIWHIPCVRMGSLSNKGVFFILLAVTTGSIALLLYGCWRIVANRSKINRDLIRDPD